MNFSIRGEVLSAAGPSPSILEVSVVGVCSGCGTPWFRLEVTAGEWRAYTVACPDCPPWPFTDTVPGSILSTVGVDMLDRLPPEVLKHEFKVHMKFFEKRSQQHEGEIR